jgi:hypothetical protein
MGRCGASGDAKPPVTLVPSKSQTGAAHGRLVAGCDFVPDRPGDFVLECEEREATFDYVWSDEPARLKLGSSDHPVKWSG